MINPNLKHLRLFVEIVRRSSFRRAAEALHLSEPAVSQAITQLEVMLGVKLLDRQSMLRLRCVRCGNRASIEN